MIESNFRFDMPYLTKLAFENNIGFSPASQIVNIHNHYSVSVHQINETSAVVELSLDINENEENVPFRMSIANAARFSWNDYTQEQVEKLLRINAPALLLGYLRPIVSSITVSASLPAYNLPLLNFQEEK